MDTLQTESQAQNAVSALGMVGVLLQATRLAPHHLDEKSLLGICTQVVWKGKPLKTQGPKGRVLFPKALHFCQVSYTSSASSQPSL